MLLPKLAVPYIEGADDFNAAVAVAFAELEKLRNLDALPPLRVTVDANGFPTISGAFGGGARYALTTSAVPAAASAESPGKGSVALRHYDGDASAPIGGPDAAVRNPTTQTIASGTLVTVVQVDGWWSVVTVYDCEQLT